VRCVAARRQRRGTALLVPPWKIPSARLLVGWVRLLSGAGWDAWLLTPPHHLERLGAGERRGEGFVSADLDRLRTSVVQLVLEVRLCAAVAARRGEVGVVGLSLGALAAALAATGPEPLDFAALVSPPADLAAVLEGTAIGHRYRELARRAGSPVPGPEALRAALRPLDPSARRPSARRIFVAAGLHDAIVAPAGPERLARAWGAETRVYPRGHLTLLFGCRALRRDLRSFLAS
jgi:predicted alpha/beta hydrolase family esterase